MTWHDITLHLKKHDMTSIFEHALFAWHDVTFHNLIKWLTCSFETVNKQMRNVDTLANKFEIQFLVVIPSWHVVTNIMWYSNLVWFGWSAPVGETGPALPPRPKHGVQLSHLELTQPRRSFSRRTKNEEKSRPSNNVKHHASTGGKREQEKEKEKIEVLQRGQNRQTANQAQRRLTTKKVEEYRGMPHRTRGQRGPRQSQTTKNLSKKNSDSEGRYGTAIDLEKDARDMFHYQPGPCGGWGLQ